MKVLSVVVLGVIAFIRAEPMTPEFQCFLDRKCLEGLPDKIIKQLSNYHLVFIGDSLTRYQYLSMAYAIRHRQLLNPLSMPNLVEQKTFSTWDMFFETSNALLSPLEVCDCQKRIGDDLTTWYENRYFYDPEFNITISYFGLFGNIMQGHLWANEEKETALVSGYPNITTTPPKWHYETSSNVDEFFVKVLANVKPKPDAVVFNYGKWHITIPEVSMATMMLNVFNIVDLFIWKSTTVNAWETGKGFEYAYGEDEKFRAYDAVTIMNTNWTADVNMTFRSDGDHFKEPVYSVLNYQLLDILKQKQMEAKEAE